MLALYNRECHLQILLFIVYWGIIDQLIIESIFDIFSHLAASVLDHLPPSGAAECASSAAQSVLGSWSERTSVIIVHFLQTSN